MIPNAISLWLDASNACVAFSKIDQAQEVEDNKEEIISNRIRNDHIGFEKIHPFIDGNGRLGRILMNWQRIQCGLDILVIWEIEKQEYYKWFI